MRCHENRSRIIFVLKLILLSTLNIGLIWGQTEHYTDEVHEMLKKLTPAQYRY